MCLCRTVPRVEKFSNTVSAQPAEVLGEPACIVYVVSMAIVLNDKHYETFLENQFGCGSDAAHDLSHVRRVVRTAVQLAEAEGAVMDVVYPAAWLHDCVVVPKDSADRSKASTLAAEAATAFLRSVEYPSQYLDDIHHAIEAHSFSRGMIARTLEAKVVQDADRLDALGAIGIARCFSVGGRLGRLFYSPIDPFCEERPPDDLQWTVDHFFQKLLRLEHTMQTATGRDEAGRRTVFIQAFLEKLRDEIRTV